MCHISSYRSLGTLVNRDLGREVQYVCLQNSYIDLLKVVSGIPYGSILDTHLFLGNIVDPASTSFYSSHIYLRMISSAECTSSSLLIVSIFKKTLCAHDILLGNPLFTVTYQISELQIPVKYDFRDLELVANVVSLANCGLLNMIPWLQEHIQDYWLLS